MRVADVGKFWTAFQWSDEARSKEAFERVMEKGYTGVHRTAQPMHPPHKTWSVFVLAESAEPIEAAKAICRELGGKPHEPPPGFIAALRRRRVELAVRNALEGKPADAKRVERDTRNVVDAQGRFRPLRGGEISRAGEPRERAA